MPVQSGAYSNAAVAQGLEQGPGTGPASEPNPHEPDEHAGGWHEWARVGFVALLLLVVWTGVVPRFHRLDLVALTGILVGGFPIFSEASRTS